MKKYILIGTSLLLVIGLLAGCGGVKQEDLDAANAAKNAAQAQVTTLQNEVDTLQNQLDAASAAQSQAEANKAIARRFAQVWAPGNLAIVDELAASDIVISYPSLPEPLHGPEAFKALVTQFHTAFPDASISADDVIAEGDAVALSFTWGGTHQGELMGIPATGKSFMIRGIVIYRIVDGKVVGEKGLTDSLGMFMQLGFTLAPAQNQ